MFTVRPLTAEDADALRALLVNRRDRDRELYGRVFAGGFLAAAVAGVPADGGGGVGMFEVRSLTPEVAEALRALLLSGAIGTANLIHEILPVGFRRQQWLAFRRMAGAA